MTSKKVILGVTGSVAATLTPKLVAGLIKAGHEVRMVVTAPAMYFIPTDSLSRSFTDLVLDEFGLEPVHIWKDKDEWPAGRYHRDDEVRHIEFRTWADVLLIAPLTANTLAKIANGICDNFLTCIARAWPKHKPLVIAPAMNTEMWQDPITAAQINLLYAINEPSGTGSVKMTPRFTELSVIEPVEKRLACGDVGQGAMADIKDIIAAVNNNNGL